MFPIKAVSAVADVRWMGLFGSIFSKNRAEESRLQLIPMGTTLLVDGDATAALGWPRAKQWEQQRNLIHFLNVLDDAQGSVSLVVFAEHRSTEQDQLTAEGVQFAGPRWTIAEHIARLADALGDRDVLIATDQPHLFRNAITISVGELLDQFIAS